MSQCCWETENISGLKECHYFCCKNVPGSLASPSDICSSLFSANANSSSQERRNIPLRSQTHLSSGLLCSCQQLSHLGFITEPSPPARHFCCWQFCSKSHGANLRCSFPVALHISFPPSKVMWDKPHEKTHASTPTHDIKCFTLRGWAGCSSRAVGTWSLLQHQLQGCVGMRMGQSSNLGAPQGRTHSGLVSGRIICPTVSFSIPALHKLLWQWSFEYPFSNSQCLVVKTSHRNYPFTGQEQWEINIIKHTGMNWETGGTERWRV